MKLNFILTKRDKILLICIFTFVFFYLITILVAIPMYDSIVEERTRRDELSEEATGIRAQLSRLNDMQETREALHLEYNDLMTDYFSTLVQEYIIVDLSEKLDQSGMTDLTISYSEIASELSPNSIIEIRRMNIAMTFTGTYEQIMDFISEIESYNKTLVIGTISLQTALNDMITGSMTVIYDAFYTEHYEGTPNEFDWYELPVNKVNPFSQNGEYSYVNTITPPQQQQETPPQVEQNTTVDDVPTDLMLSLNSIYSDLSTFFVSISNAQDFNDYVRSDRNEFIDVNIRIYNDPENPNGILANITGEHIFERTLSFTPHIGGEINMKVFGSSRAGDDFSGARVVIENDTNTPVNVHVRRDDPVMPRFVLTNTRGPVALV